MYLFSHLEDFVRNIYIKMNVFSPSQFHLHQLSDVLNIDIFFIPSPSQVLYFEGRSFIFIDERISSEKQFEEFGHELGHFFLHDADQQDMKNHYRDFQEWKANLFALHFCIPTFMLLRLPQEELTSENVSELFGVTIPFAYKRLLMHQQRLFGISLLRNEKRLSP